MKQAAGWASERNVDGRVWSRMVASYRRHWFAYAMLVPVLVVVSVLVFYPLAHGLFLTFTNADATNAGDVRNPPSFDLVGLRNYIEILSGERATSTGQTFWTILWRTVIWTAINVFFHYIIGLGLAVMLNRPLRFRGLYRVVLLIPWAMPQYITASSWRFLFNESSGSINQLLSIFGLDGVAWLGSARTAFIAVIIVNVWMGVPFMMVALLGGLQSIPDDLYDAAAIDGASAWQKFRYVTMPLLRPVSATMVLLGIIWTFNAFVIIFLVTQGGPAEATEILVTFAFDEAFVNPSRNYALAATYGALILSLLLVFANIYQRMLRSFGDTAWQ